MSPRFRIKGFGDLSAREIADLTGLTFSKAVLARQREFTEPFLIEDEGDLKELEYFALKENLKITRGGRFYHLIGIHQGKGEAVKILKRIVKRNVGENVQFVGIGDSANDIPMLLQMDIPVLIPHPDGGYEDVSMPNLVKAASPGSDGWNHAVFYILNRKV
jgi:mannosyl-3-phosphoglycerate phosphatase